MVIVTVVVLGDIGRSPRMQYHASSLATEGYNVEIIGYGDSKPIKEVADNKRIKIFTLNESPEFKKTFPTLIAYILKTLYQAFVLFICLLFKDRSNIILVQTPPAIPTLAVCWIYCLIVRAFFVVDWHNYAFKNMALSLGDQNRLVRISRSYEGFFGRRADYNICVTKSMKDDLKTRWDVTATVLYDRPFDSFTTVTVDVKHSFFKRISQQYPVFKGENSENATVFTSCLANGTIELKLPRPALLVSSTSWTEDEDFSILLNALKIYDKLEVDDVPDVICVITGKGPLKDYYIKLIDGYDWKRVKIITPWLEPEDYPLMLGSADLGVSLHTSTSGFDLPMKVVDMFGCGLPVAAYSFFALPELVRAGENGTIFKTSDELAEQLEFWFKGFPNKTDHFNKYKKNIEEDFQSLRWHENWICSVSSIFESSTTPYFKKPITNDREEKDK